MVEILGKFVLAIKCDAVTILFYDALKKYNNMILLCNLYFINHKKHPLTQNFTSNRMPTLR